MLVSLIYLALIYFTSFGLKSPSPPFWQSGFQNASLRLLPPADHARWDNCTVCSGIIWHLASSNFLRVSACLRLVLANLNNVIYISLLS